MSRIVSLLNRLFHCREIVNCERELYLRRWYLVRTEWLGVFIHQFVRSDEDRALHDHPWNFIVVPLWRGYIEHNERKCRKCHGDGWGRFFEDCSTCGGTCLVPNKTRVLPLLGMRFRKGTYKHRVELIAGKPSWSLFFRFRSWREWGFWLPEGFKLWNEFWKEKCE